MDEVATAKVVLSCLFFALDSLCDEESGAVPFDSLSIGSLSPDLGDVAKWTSHKPNVGRRFGPALHR